MSLSLTSAHLEREGLDRQWAQCQHWFASSVLLICLNEIVKKRKLSAKNGLNVPRCLLRQRQIIKSPQFMTASCEQLFHYWDGSHVSVYGQVVPFIIPPPIMVSAHPSSPTYYDAILSNKNGATFSNVKALWESDTFVVVVVVSKYLDLWEAFQLSPSALSASSCLAIYERAISSCYSDLVSHTFRRFKVSFLSHITDLRFAENSNASLGVAVGSKASSCMT